MKILHVVGARPNYMKTAPVMAAMKEHPDRIQQFLVHTGQHYDVNMSDVFFQDLNLQLPDKFLGVGSGSHAQQTARVMIAFEPIVQEYAPDLVLVVGDVNSTLACALVCSKLGIRVGHIEAGLRSNDRTMPEEINRIVTDQLADLLFTPSRDGDQNLLWEGIEPHRIKFVGNVMIDTLVRMLPQARQRWQEISARLDLKDFVLATLHRPANVDDPAKLEMLLKSLEAIGNRQRPVVFPVHPRTHDRIEKSGLHIAADVVRLIEPLGYLDFLALECYASLVITDSGGVQEETTYLGVPCLTIRPNTERPITIEQGTNQLVSADPDVLVSVAKSVILQERKTLLPIEFWDGNAAKRIVATILDSV